MPDPSGTGSTFGSRVTRQQRRAEERRARKLRRSGVNQLAVGAAFVFGAVSAGSASAAVNTIHVTSTSDVTATDSVCTLREAILNANANADVTGGDCEAGVPGLDIIDVSSQTGTITLTQGQMKIIDALEIDGPGSGALTIDAVNASRVFYAGTDGVTSASSFSISGATLNHGSDSARGGAIRGVATDLTLLDVTITNSSAPVGGGVDLYEGSATITNSTLSGNQAAVRGGGLNLYSLSSLSLTNVTIQSNTAKYGGGVSEKSGTLTTVTGSNITGNTAGNFGGGLLIDSASLSVDSTSVLNNNATNNSGGGINFYNGSLTVTDSTISGNHASTSGGGIFAFYADTVALAQVTIQNNTALDGAGVALYAGSVSITAAPAGARSTISGNIANGRGGGAVFAYSSDVTISDTDITANKAGHGGGIFFYGYGMSISDSTISGNEALGGRGGGIYLYHTSYFYRNNLHLDNVTMLGNHSANSGGAIFASPYCGSHTEILNSTISGNDASVTLPSVNGTGGAVQISPYFYYYSLYGYSGSPSACVAVTISSSTFENNAARNSGGALYLGIVDLSLTGGSISTNTAGDSGGGVYLWASNASITDATISGNHAGSRGGGVYDRRNYYYVGLGDFTMTGGSVTTNTATESGGGIYLYYADTRITGTTISGNTAGGAGGGVYESGGIGLIDAATIEANQSGVFGGGLYTTGVDITVQNSTLSGNTALQGGGGANLWYSSSAAVVNSTVSGNTTPAFGGGLSIGGVVSTRIEECTITGNTAGPDSGGGVDFFAYNFGSGVMTNSIVSGSDPSPAPPTTGDVTSSGNIPLLIKFSDVETESTLHPSTDGGGNIHADPQLGPLQNNGGPTKTQLPVMTSPVIDAGDPAFAPPPDTDQRGPGFPRVQQGRIDMGSVEVLQPPGTIQLTALTASVNEGAGFITITATRTGGKGGAVSVQYNTVPGSADASDFTPASGTFTWADGDDTPKTVNVAITEDNVGEPAETFAFTISNPTGGATLGGVTTETITIIDNEPGQFEFSAAAYPGTEGSGVTITVNRVNGSAGTVSVDLADAGTGSATSGADYTAFAPVTLTWADGDTAPKTFTIPIATDAVFDDNETINLVLQNAVGGTLGTQTTTTVNVDDPGNPGVIEFSSATFSGTEGSSASVVVNRTGGTTGPVTADVVITGGTAAQGSDYTLATTTTITWADGDSTPQTIPIPLASDGIFDPNETISLQLQNITSAAPGAQSTTTVTIVDDERGKFDFSAAAYPAVEGSGVTITVNRSNGSFGAVSVDVADAGTGSATSGSDYAAFTPVTLTWADGDVTPKTFTIPIATDGFFDPGETINLLLQNATGGSLGTQTTATVTIADPGNAGVVQFSSATFSGTEGGSVNVTVTRTVGATGPVSADVVITGAGTATQGTDYTLATTTTLTWADGDASPRTINIPLTSDTGYDPNETISLQLQNVTSATPGPQSTTTVTIVDPGQLQFSAAAYPATEGSSVTITVNRVNGTSGAVSVQVADAGTGTATSGSDYTAFAPVTLTWADGDVTPKTFTIPIATDGFFDPGETINLLLQNVTGGSLGTQQTATVTIADPGNAGVVQFSSATFSGTEGGSVNVTVTRTVGATGPVSADVVITGAGTATQGTDYTLATTTNLTWADGDASPRTINIPLVGDTVYDPNETIALQLQNVTSATPGPQSTTTVTIVDPGQLQFSAAAYPATEGTSVTITVNRVNGSSGAVSVQVADAGTGTATSGSDYTAFAPVTLSWADGDVAAKTITIPIATDGFFDPGETINLLLQNVTGGSLGTQQTATVTIADPGNAGVIQFSSATFSGTEGGSVAVTVTRTVGATGPVSADVVITGAGTATQGTDYTLATTTNLTWADGDASPRTINIPLAADTVYDPNETIALLLQNVTSATPGPQSTTTVTIVDPGQLQFSAAAYPASEGTSVTITVNRVNGTSGAVSVQVADAGTGSATSGSDYTAFAPVTLSWADGDTAPKSFTIPIATDAIADPGETIALALQNFNGGSPGAQTTATVTIADVAGPGSLQFSSATYTVSENGGAATITVDRVGGAGGSVSVTYATSNGTATAGSDYTTAGGTLTWADGDSAPKSFTVPILDDTSVESPETVNLTLSGPTNGATLGTSSAVLTINDFEPGTIAVSGSSDMTVNEADGSITITLNRGNGSNGAVTVDFSTTPGTATAPGDFTAITGSVTWADGDTTPKTITIPITVDSTPEAPESFTVNLTATSGGAVVANPTITITILDTNAIPTLAFWMKLMLILVCGGIGVIMLKNGRILVVVLAATVAVATAPVARAANPKHGQHQHKGPAALAAGTVQSVSTSENEISLTIDSSTFRIAKRRLLVIAAPGERLHGDATSLKPGTAVTYRARVGGDGSVKHMRVKVFATLADANKAVQRHTHP